MKPISPISVNAVPGQGRWLRVKIKSELGWGGFPEGRPPLLNPKWEGADAHCGRGRKNLTSPGNRAKMSHNTKKNLEEG